MTEGEGHVEEVSPSPLGVGLGCPPQKDANYMQKRLSSVHILYIFVTY